MILEKTTFILGAGVSIPYGYPSGAVLLDKICTDIVSGYLDSIWKSFDIHPNEAKSFAHVLRQSQVDSIDIFLELRPEYLTIGKIAIAFEILSRENLNNLFLPANSKVGIYRYLLNKLVDKCKVEEFNNNNISFITFNYDRSLEVYLYFSLMALGNLNQEELSSLVNGIKIIHIHGVVDSYMKDLDGGFPYCGMVKEVLASESVHKRIEKAISEIRISSEDKNNHKRIKEVSQIIESSKNVYFLGFGYHENCLEKIGVNISDSKKDKAMSKFIHREYRGSAYGLGRAQMDNLKNGYKIYIPSKKHNSLAFLKEYAHLH